MKAKLIRYSSGLIYLVICSAEYPNKFVRILITDPLKLQELEELGMKIENLKPL